MASSQVLESLQDADEVIALLTLRNFHAVGQHYRGFSPTTDDAWARIRDTPARRAAAAGASAESGRDEQIAIPAGSVALHGNLHLPTERGGVVVFAHGRANSRRSPRYRFVAALLQNAGLGTLLLDRLTPGRSPARMSLTSTC